MRVTREERERMTFYAMVIADKGKVSGYSVKGNMRVVGVEKNGLREAEVALLKRGNIPEWWGRDVTYCDVKNPLEKHRFVITSPVIITFARKLKDAEVLGELL